jgi:hypothetical protein
VRRVLALAVLLASAVVVMVGLLARAVPLVSLIAAAAAILAMPALLVARRDRAAAIAVAMSAIVLAPLLAVPTYYAAHPTLHIDNASDAPIDVWIDGVRRATVPPSSESREPAWVRIAVGKHRLAWSAVGAPVGMHEIEVEVGPLDDHLYTPAAAGCYWLSVTAYGGASTHGIEHGPLPLLEFHRFSSVDVWFGDTPRRVRAPAITRGTVRIAIQRWQACMELAAIGCDPTQRRGYVDCMRTIDGRIGSGDCFQEAARTCPKAAPPRENPAAQPAQSTNP